MVNLNYMTSQAGQQAMVINILFNISKGKVNQTMKFGQLIEYNMSNIFLKNHTENVEEKLVPYHLLEN